MPSRVNSIARPRLMSTLDRAIAHRLTSVIGGPGTGKTTLLAQWAATHRTITVSATPADTLASLMRTILDGVRHELGWSDSELAMALAGSGLPTTDIDPTRPDALAAALCQCIARDGAGSDLTLIVDDVHTIDADDEAVALLAGLVRHAPPRLHLVLSSRRELPFPTNRIVIDGEAIEIDTADLAFTVPEATTLLSRKGDAAPTIAEELVRRTGGWAIATAFAARAAEAGTAGAADPVRDNERLFGYFADEFLASADRETLDALVVLAALPWSTTELAEHLDLGSAGGQLTDPRRAGVVMVPSAERDGAVSVAPLVREFLRRPGAVSVADPERLRELIERATSWYEKHGAPTSALRCLVAHEDVVAVTDLVRRRGDEMIAAGQAHDVLEAIGLIEREQQDLRLGLLEAEALQSLGASDEARRRYERMISPTGPVPASVAWRLGFLLYMRGATDQARAILDRGSLNGGEPADEAALLAWTAATRWAMGDRDAAADLADEAMNRARSVDDARSLATALTIKAMVAAIDGDRVANFTYYLQALEQAERARDLMQVVRIRCNCGSHHLEVGDYRQAMDELEPAIRLADLGGYGMFRALSLTNRAEVLIAWGRFDEAVADLDIARSIFARIAPDMDMYPLTLLGRVHAARGESAQALGAFELAVSLAERRDDVQGLVPALAGLALARLEDDPAEALVIARRASARDKAVAHPLALLALGWVTLANGNVDEARELAAHVAELARARRDRPSLAEALELEAAVQSEPAGRLGPLHEARSLWSELAAPFARARVDLAIAETMSGTEAVALAESAAATFERIGAKRMSAKARMVSTTLMNEHGAELSVQVLGRFALVRNGEVVPTSAWQSKVARDLFKMLAVNRGRPIPRDMLIDRLWPGESGDKANNRLSVALSTIRSIIDPDRSHTADSVLVADRDSVALDLEHIAIDVELFLADVDRGRALIRQRDHERGLAILRLAETRYIGDLLEEQPYADWAVTLREEALTKYLSIALVLAEADTAAGDHESAASRYLRMLERDPYNEHAHLGAVRALRAAGHHGPAQRLYRNYVTKMAEIEIEPATFPAA